MADVTKKKPAVRVRVGAAVNIKAIATTASSVKILTRRA